MGVYPTLGDPCCPKPCCPDSYVGKILLSKSCVYMLLHNYIFPFIINFPDPLGCTRKISLHLIFRSTHSDQSPENPPPKWGRKLSPHSTIFIPIRNRPDAKKSMCFERESLDSCGFRKTFVHNQPDLRNRVRNISHSKYPQSDSFQFKNFPFKDFNQIPATRKK